MENIDLIKVLNRLNRKERYFLFKSAVFGNTECKLCDEFIQKLNDKTSLSIPKDAFLYLRGKLGVIPLSEAH